MLLESALWLLTECLALWLGRTCLNKNVPGLVHSCRSSWYLDPGATHVSVLRREGLWKLSVVCGFISLVGELIINPPDGTETPQGQMSENNDPSVVWKRWSSG